MTFHMEEAIMSQRRLYALDTLSQALANATAFAAQAAGIRLLSLGVLALAGTVLAGTPLAAAQMASDAQVRVIHASPDAPPVDIWVDGAPAITGLAFGQATAHVRLPVGAHQVAVTPAGAPPESAVIAATLDLAAGQAYTVMAVGPLAEIKPLILTDQRQNGSTESHVRFVHASPGAPAVDIAVAGGPTVFRDVAFGQGSDYVDVPAGDLDLEVRVAGTDTTVLRVPGASFAEGGIYTLAAIGLAGGSPELSALAISDRSYSN
jgi:hypothetical protein